ncbi:hypothetical protein [Mycolicibacterium agri]|uniref:Uncharacterized protein n=1 Tax=Mycolicibacterium agri TaxID=36811 RepID=A0A7I9VY92_MYCAG|nr:hypothetical protein [Mycolicibacterium agri]GFG49946.1 hypothetical protein MAGR_13870 [Mycolicibacterium agri]
MTAVLASHCTGLWRRTLLINPDGSRDLGADVMWLQGITAYVDSRGFAGRLQQDGEVFSWCRDIDLLPPGPYPDEGYLRWDGSTLIETGVHENYTERWVPEERAGALDASGAFFLAAPDAGRAVLVRVGQRYGWACHDAVVVGTVADRQWCDLAIEQAGNEIRVKGVRWVVQEWEGNVNI